MLYVQLKSSDVAEVFASTEGCKLFQQFHEPCTFHSLLHRALWILSFVEVI